MSSFTAKKLRATITLADDSCTVFTSTGDNTLVAENLRMAARVNVNARQSTTMDLKIWGLHVEDMDALTAAWMDSQAVRDNRVILDADSGDGYRQVFEGTIIEAQPDYSRAPDVPFQILSTIRYFEQIGITPALSYQGAVDIDTLGQYFADKLKLSYLNIGAKATLKNPYYPGTIFDQLRNACIEMRVDFYFQGTTLVFSPLNVELSGEPAVVLSPKSGLLGYPMYTRRGLLVNAIYDAAYQCASPIEIQDSAVKGANGRWYPFAMEMNLSSMLPGGPWNVALQCNKPGK